MSTPGSSSPTPPFVEVHSQPFGARYLLFHLCSLFRSTDPPPFPQTPLAALCRQFAGTFRSMQPALPLLFVLPSPSTVPSPSTPALTLPPLFLTRALSLLYQRALHHTGPRLASLYRACCSLQPLSDGLFDAWQAFRAALFLVHRKELRVCVRPERAPPPLARPVPSRLALLRRSCL